MTNFTSKKRLLKMKYKFVIFILLILFFYQKTKAQFFNQDFNISTTVGDYEGTSPTTRQFDEVRATGGVASSITTNRMQFARTGNGTGLLLRRTDIVGGTSTNAIMVRFDINQLSGSNAGNPQAAVFQLGTTFSSGNGTESGSNLFAQFFIHNSSTNNQFRVSIDGSTTSTTSFNPTQRITFVANRSGSSITYRNPNNTTTTLGTGNIDLWVGTTQVITNTAIPSGTATTASDFKFVFNPSINTTIQLDDISIFPLPTFPTGTYTVGTAATVAAATSTFTSITRNGGGFFEVLNFTSNINGSNTFSVNSNIINEDGTNDLKQLNGMSAMNVIRVQPDIGGRLVSGNGNPFISFNGADYVSFDGGLGGTIIGTNRLTFRQTANNVFLQFINDATNFTINDCIFESNSTSANGFFFFSTGTSSGNDNINVSNCVLRNRTDVATANPRLAINSTGSSISVQNDNITFDACEFINFFSTTNSSTHIVNIVSNTNNFTLKNSHIYQAASYNMGGSAIYTRLISIAGTNTDNITIDGNFFGGRAINGGGGAYRHFSSTAGVRFGINHILSTMASGTMLTIQNNTFLNMQTDFNENIAGSSNRWVCISGSGRMIIKGNKFTNLRFSMSSNTPSVSNTTIQGIVYSGDGTGEITSNIIEDTQFTNNASVTSGFNFEALRLSPTSSGLVVSQNTIGSISTSNNILVSSHTSANDVIAINAVNTNAFTISNNTIANITNNSTNANSTFYGINQTGTANNNITTNTIYNLTSTAQQANNTDNVSVAGIRINAAPTNITIQSNKIYSIRGQATVNTTVVGMIFTGGINGRTFNNQIYDITNNIATSTAPIAAGIVIRNIGSSGTYAGFHTYNNRISLGLQPLTGSGTSNPDQTLFIGIWNNLNDTDKLYSFFNSVNIGGTASGGAYKTFCFFRGDNPESAPDASLVTTPLQVYNNIFQNSRTGGSGAHYAIGIQDITSPDQAPCPASTNEYSPDYNVYYAPDATKMGEAGGAAVNFATWQTSFTPNIDTHSYDASPSATPIAFIDVGVADMHLTVNDQRPDGRALPIATELGFPLTIDFDIDNEFRRSTDAGADELEQTILFTGNLPNDDWHNPANWTVSGSVPERNVVPNCADNVVIPAGKVVKVYQNSIYNLANNPALFYTLTIQNGGRVELENNTTMNSCWYNDELTVNQIHKGEFKNETGGIFVGNGGTLNIAGRFTDSGDFQKGLSTVVMNRDRPELDNECLERYIHARNDDSKVSNMAGTANTNFHNLTIYTNESFASGGTVKDDAFSGNTTIIGTHDISVGDATSDLGTLDIQGVALGTGGWIAANGNKLTLEGDLTENNGTITGSTTSKLNIFGKASLTGTLKFTDADADGFEDFQEVVMNRPNNGLAILGNKSLRINNFLDLTEGRLKTGNIETTYEANVTNSNATSSVTNYLTTGYTGKGWVWGQLRRAIAGVASYKYPIGDATRYELIDIDIKTSLGTTSNILGYFNPNNAPGSVNLTENGIPYTNLCVNGYWQMTPNAQPSSGNFDVNLFPVGIACSGAPINFAKSPTGAGTYSFAGSTPVTTISRSGFTDFSDITLITPLVVLPVEFISFNAIAQNNSALITWETVWEKNNDYFEVEKSIDGRNFFVIGKIEGKGTTNEKNSYQLIDNEPRKGINYYRLRQIDFDGKVNYSKIVSLLFEGGEDVFEIYPNPANGLDVTILISAKAGDALSIKVIDALGRNVFMENKNYQNGQLRLKSSEAFAKGIYFVIVQNITTGKIDRKKLIIE